MALFDDFDRTDTSYSLYAETSYGYLNRSARCRRGGCDPSSTNGFLNIRPGINTN